MFLSRVRLNPSRLQTRRMASSPQVTHALVEASAPPGGEHRAGRALWRLDHDDTGMDLYVVSPWRPDFTGLIEQAGWPTAPTWDTASYDRFLERLAEGQRWRFRVTANPTRSVPRGEGRGRVAPHRTAAHQSQWFSMRSGGWGFAITGNGLGAENLAVVERRTLRFSRHSGPVDDRRRDVVSLTTVTVAGELEVTSAGALRQALAGGLGRAKGYGCGLLTLAPPA